MEKYFTVQSTKALQGPPDNYGNITHAVTFEGEKDNALYRHSPSTNLEPGTRIFGIIEELPTKAGGTYRKFTKKMIPEGYSEEGTAPVGNAPQSSSNAPQATFNGGDGARQGMSINNAAKYVIDSAVKDSITLSPQELADEITRYALEIYKIDLTVTVNSPDEFEDLQ